VLPAVIARGPWGSHTRRRLDKQRQRSEGKPMWKILKRIDSKFPALCLAATLVVGVGASEANGKETARKSPIIKVDSVRARIDDDGNPWVSFEATASRAFRSGWIVVKAKCKTEMKTKVDESQAVFSEVDAGDTKELEEPFPNITLPEGAEWCQFEFRYKENVFFSAGVPLRVFCWQGREVVPDTKCPTKATDPLNPPLPIRGTPARQPAWPDGPEGADHNW